MTLNPVVEADYYGKGFEHARYVQAMKGSKAMNFGAHRTDQERLNEAISKNKISDSDPCRPEWQAWSLRPRNKSKEIGPSMKFNSHLQAERLMEKLRNTTATFFPVSDVVGDGLREGGLERQVKSYNKTGMFEIPAYNIDDDDDHQNNKKTKSLRAQHGSVPTSPAMHNSMFKVEERQSKL